MADLELIKEALALFIGAGGVFVLASIRADLRHVLDHLEDHEERLRSVEKEGAQSCCNK